jgi:hypothetical protein
MSMNAYWLEDGQTLISRTSPALKMKIVKALVERLASQPI